MRLALIASAVIFLALTCPLPASAQTTAAKDEAYWSEMRPVDKKGCRAFWDNDSERKRAIKACDRVLAKPGNLTDRQRGYAYLVRGQAQAQLKNFSAAVADYNQAAVLLPTWEVYYERGQAHKGLNNQNEAAADYRSAADLGSLVAEFALRPMRESCPSLTWDGNVCRTVAEAPPPLIAEAPTILADPPLPLLDTPAATQPPPAQSWFEWRPWRSKSEPQAPTDPPQPPPENMAEIPPPTAPPPAAPPVAPLSAPATNLGELAPIPSGCPIDQQYGGWVVRRGSVDGIPVVTTGPSIGYSGTTTAWTADGLALEMVPTREGKWMYFLFVKNLKNAGSPVTEISGHYGVSLWDGATKKGFSGLERKNGGGSLYKAPYTVVGLPPWFIEEVLDKIEATPEVNISLVMPAPGGNGLIDVEWYRPFTSRGIRAAMVAGQACALN